MIDKALLKEFGESAFATGNDLSYGNELVSISPRLDIITGGGIPGGSFVNLSGDQKCGKTTLALSILRNAQKQDRPTYFFNIEGRIKARDVKGIRGLDLNKLHIIRSSRDPKTNVLHVLPAEAYLTIAEQIIRTVPRAVLVFDSVSQLASEKEFEADIGTTMRAPGAVLMSQFCRKVSNVVPVNDTIVISILHLIANTSGYGPSKIPSGGRKIAYACDIGLVAKSFKFKRPGGKDDEGTQPPYGQEVVWQTTSTAICAPGQQITSYIRYGVGVDELLETLMLAVDTQLINKKGSWFTINYNGEEHKLQGEEKACNFLSEHEDLVVSLNKEIHTMIFG